MKYLIPLLIAAVLAPLVLAGCSSGGGSAEDNWTYVGTWANPDYEGNAGSGPPAKVVMTSSGMTAYDDIAAMTELYTGTFAMADAWTSGGMHYFKGIAVMSGGMGSATQFFLMRVSNNNNTLETTSSDLAYPPTINPAGQYGIFGRQ